MPTRNKRRAALNRKARRLCERIRKQEDEGRRHALRCDLLRVRLELWRGRHHAK